MLTMLMIVKLMKSIVSDSYVLVIVMSYYYELTLVSQNQYVVSWCKNACYFNIYAHLHIICISNNYILINL